MGLKETGQKIVKKVIRVFARGSGKSLSLQRGIPIMVEVPEYDSKDYKFSYNRKVTYQKKKSQAKRKAWKKHGLQGRGRKK
ncbi:MULTISPECIES: hypothetical protein [Bacillus]|uniref:Uncharacterized protein n=1 Tax=Bacillus thuringiensis DB27 TaxID=1431339 RepID=W8Y1C6_BACTU|nr:MULTISPECIES: hypothetical protein [Bacillus]KAB7656657.1 hypothetical protein GBN78_11550 [Bacillus sp. B2-WWTP-C-10-Post-4]MBG9632728.1 hypothetical protein [Bacillus thuringiensis]MBG9669053.1 hypothetical protein [Bacillus thuringiensis]MBH0355643.1 hypothetical protein [Bacillus thuringiensis]CDN35264.1 unnamed protein product [Bacillus thuringiensis DB27]